MGLAYLNFKKWDFIWQDFILQDVNANINFAYLNLPRLLIGLLFPVYKQQNQSQACSMQHLLCILRNVKTTEKRMLIIFLPKKIKITIALCSFCPVLTYNRGTKRRMFIVLLLTKMRIYYCPVQHLPCILSYTRMFIVLLTTKMRSYYCCFCPIT